MKTKTRVTISETKAKKLDTALRNLLNNMMLPLQERALVKQWYSTTCSNEFLSKSRANWDC